MRRKSGMRRERRAAQGHGGVEVRRCEVRRRGLTYWRWEVVRRKSTALSRRGWNWLRMAPRLRFGFRGPGVRFAFRSWERDRNPGWDWLEIGALGWRLVP